MVSEKPNLKLLWCDSAKAKEDKNKLEAMFNGLIEYRESFDERDIENVVSDNDGKCVLIVTGKLAKENVSIFHKFKKKYDYWIIIYCRRKQDMQEWAAKQDGLLIKPEQVFNNMDILIKYCKEKIKPVTRDRPDTDDNRPTENTSIVPTSTTDENIVQVSKDHKFDLPNKEPESLYEDDIYHQDFNIIAAREVLEEIKFLFTEKEQKAIDFSDPDIIEFFNEYFKSPRKCWNKRMLIFYIEEFLENYSE